MSDPRPTAGSEGTGAGRPGGQAAGFGRDVGHTLLAQGPVIAFGLAASVLTARGLGPEGRGVYALCLMIASVAVFFGRLGLGESVAYHVGRRRLAAGRVLVATLVVATAMSALVLAALRAGAPLLARSFPSLSTDAFAVVVWAAPLMLLGGVLTDFFRGIDRLALFNLCRMLTPGLRLVTLAAAFALGGGLVEALLALLVAELAVLPIQLVLVTRLAPPRFDGFRQVVRSVAGFGVRFEAGAAIAHVNQLLAGFIVAYHLAADQLAFWSIGEALVRNLLTLPALVSNVLLPKIAGQSDLEASRATATACRGTLFLMAGVALALGIAAQPLVWLLYGREYLPATLVVVALLPFAVLRSGMRILTRYLIVSNRLRIFAISNAAMLLVQSAMLVALVPPLGILGAALALSASAAAPFLIVLLAFRADSGLPLGEALLVRRDELTRLARSARSLLARPAARQPR